MRLVDAEKQLKWVDCMTPLNGIGLEHVVAVETVRDLIKGAPTIDAIPVAWMSKFCADDIAEDQRETIEWMLKVWRREQEAR